MSACGKQGQNRRRHYHHYHPQRPTDEKRPRILLSHTNTHTPFHLLLVATASKSFKKSTTNTMVDSNTTVTTTTSKETNSTTRTDSNKMPTSTTSTTSTVSTVRISKTKNCTLDPCAMAAAAWNLASFTMNGVPTPPME